MSKPQTLVARQKAKVMALVAHTEKMARKVMERSIAAQPVAANGAGDVDRTALDGMVWYVQERDLATREVVAYDVHTLNNAGRHLCASVTRSRDGRWEWSIYTYTDTGPDSEADTSIEEGAGLSSVHAAFAAAESSLSRARQLSGPYRQEKV